MDRKPEWTKVWTASRHRFQGSSEFRTSEVGLGGLFCFWSGDPCGLAVSFQMFMRGWCHPESWRSSPPRK